METDDERLALFERERSGLVRLAHAMTGSHAVAEDVVHDAWLRWSARSDLTNPGGYLRTIVVNIARVWIMEPGEEPWGLQLLRADGTMFRASSYVGLPGE